MLLSAAFGAIVAGGCATSGVGPDTPPLRPPLDAPDRFRPPPATPRVPPADTVAGGGCTSPMTDPRDGAEIRMVRSWVAVGDYAVPAGRYGVGPDELLRVECNTGAPVGPVPR